MNFKNFKCQHERITDRELTGWNVGNHYLRIWGVVTSPGQDATAKDGHIFSRHSIELHRNGYD